MSNESETDQKPFGMPDDELAAYPTVFRDGLFDGRTVLVSGAGSGLGKAIAFLFARLSADLVICGRNRDKLEVTAERLRGFGADVDLHAMTIRDPEQVDAMFAAAWDRFGRLDVLINNAGGQFPQPAIDYSVKGWNAVIDTNLNGSWYMMQAAARHWRDAGQPGCIINIVANFWRGMPDIAHTGAARAAVTFLSRSLAVEWAPLRIRVNCVAPGPVETEGFNVYPKEASAKFKYTNPMLRTGDVMDIAEACVYVAAPSGKFMTGECIAVDGGQQLWGDNWAYAKPDYFKIPD